MTQWFIILLLSSDWGAHIESRIMLQPFPSRAECEKSAEFARVHGIEIEAAYCIPRKAP